MKISGFSFIRNAVKFDYPVVESIKSVLPLCDEFVIAVGDSEDETLDLIKNIGDSKIKIIETVWDDSLREGGQVLALETDKAFQQVSENSDWCIYIQGDEVIHEKYLNNIRQGMEQWQDDEQVEGLLLNYLHFYASYDFVGDSRRWYRKEIRVVRNNKNIKSYRDAQGFRINNRKLHVKPVDAFVYHYGWVKSPGDQQQKALNFNKLWHSDEWVEVNISKLDQFDYSNVDSLKHFEGTHPKVMQERIKRINWEFSFDPSQKNFSSKARLLHFIEKHTGWRIGEYKNYKII